ncbi:major facilitator superfamily domain-containing protein 10-like [Eriocheir sinensis]|uniref:major facilitator superfamily domain-containing protein 10-like n=1 Tax=Eriocheir sinensis TaxID=95602 RepID=UPI0021CA7812|nr:major facilitator superfamily domain-containing protein 10-like [Eriocheir sinensis]
MATLQSGTAGAGGDGSNNETEASQSGGEGQPSDPKQKAPLRTITVVFGGVILDLLGFTTMLPLLPALLDYYQHNDSSGLYASLLTSVTPFQHLIGVPSKFNSVLLGGLLGSLFWLVQFLSSPLTHALSDVYGRKPMFLVILVGKAVSYGLWAAASTFSLFVVACIIGSAAKGSMSLGYSIVGDTTDTHARARGRAVVGVAYNIGFTLGPVVGAAFSRWGDLGWFPASALYALALTVTNITFFTAFFRETLPQNKRRPSLAAGVCEAWKFINPRAVFSFSSLEGFSKEERNRLLQFVWFFFLFASLQSGLEFTLPFMTHHKHGYDSLAQGYMLSLLYLVKSLTPDRLLLFRLADSKKALAHVALVMMVPAFILIGVGKTSVDLYFGLTLYAIGSSLMETCLQELSPLNLSLVDVQKISSLTLLGRACGTFVMAAGFWCLGAEVCYMVGGLSLLVPLIMLRCC